MVLRGSKVDWALWEKYSVLELQQDGVREQRGQIVLTSPGSDRSHAQILCSLLFSVLFRVVSHCGSPDAKAKADRFCRDQ